MELTKRLQQRQGFSKDQAVLSVLVTLLLGTAGLFRVGSSSVILSRKKLMLFSLLYLVYAQWQKVQEVALQRGMEALNLGKVGEMIKGVRLMIGGKSVEAEETCEKES